MPLIKHFSIVPFKSQKRVEMWISGKKSTDCRLANIDFAFDALQSLSAGSNYQNIFHTYHNMKGSKSFNDSILENFTCKNETNKINT